MNININIHLKNKKKFEIVMGMKEWNNFRGEMLDDEKKFLFIDDILYIAKNEILFIEINKEIKE